jgi:hypothetical protein
MTDLQSDPSEVIQNNWLVNPTGKPDSFYGADRLVELNNLYTKVIYGGAGSNYTIKCIIKEGTGLDKQYKTTTGTQTRQCGKVNHIFCNGGEWLYILHCLVQRNWLEQVDYLMRVMGSAFEQLKVSLCCTSMLRSMMFDLRESGPR